MRPLAALWANHQNTLLITITLKMKNSIITFLLALTVFANGTASTIVLNATGTALSDGTAYVFNVSYVGY